MTRVAFQGEHGAYSEIAAGALWPGAVPTPCRENTDVVRAVERGDVDAGVLPVENSIAGTVTATLDALLASRDIHIVAEVIVPIEHCLLAVPGASLADIRWVESHPVALAQCRAFFDDHPALEPRSVYDTAGAARDIAAAGDRTRAAVASAEAARRYGLTIIREEVEDAVDNRTRFLGLSRTACNPPVGVHCRTSLAISIDDVPGALLRVLAPIADGGLNATRLETRPVGRPWVYAFALDVVHAAGDHRMTEAIAAITEVSRTCRVLGTYAASPEGW